MGKNKSKKHHKKAKRICKTIKNINKKKISGGEVSGGQSVAEWFYGMFDKMMGKKKEPQTGETIVPANEENPSFATGDTTQQQVTGVSPQQQVTGVSPQQQVTGVNNKYP